MPTGDRYYCEVPISRGVAILSGSEAHHLIHVMRVARGESVVLFDGTGNEFPARVEKVGRTEVELSVEGCLATDRELPIPLTLAVTLPKGDRQKWLIEKAVELGVTRLVPIKTARSVAQPVEQALARLGRSVVEASKQCGRNRLMTIAPAADWGDYLASAEGTACRLLAHPEDSSGPTGVNPWGQLALAPSVHLAVGPEGGFTGEEVQRACAAGWRPLGLGPRILRIETAALYLASLAADTILRRERSCPGGADHQTDSMPPEPAWIVEAPSSKTS